MNRFESALSRFQAAINSLETSLDHRLEGARAGNGEAVSELKMERDRLAARVAELEEEQRYLSGLTEEVESRLDGAISEIREALGRN